MSIHCHWCLISQMSGWMICFLDVKQWTLTVIGFWYWECKSWVKADSLHVLVSLSDSDSDFFPWFCCLWRWFIDHKFFLLFAIKFVPFLYNPVNFSISWYLSTFYWTIFVSWESAGLFLCGYSWNRWCFDWWFLVFFCTKIHSNFMLSI